MASRRPTSRMVRGSLAPPIQSRTRSSAKPTSKATAEPPAETAIPATSSTATFPTINTTNHIQKRSESSETNIQVVIRCRRRSEREIQENSPIIVSSDGAKSKELTIETGVPHSSLGVVTLPPLRTYPFDLVFGPEADQALIYHDVVSPMLEEVLMGYNCTLFAYGQTGTGKTYTMHGDLKPTPLGNPSPDAGMIPRVLFRLFHSLETSNADYSVKISYIELYNEELRDLLANEFSQPSNSTQPMGLGSKDKSAENLKIFDDSNKKGVYIQGLEEVAVKDCKHALALLAKGSDRRQIAATRFNDHSSRSHSIFSITVHVKETSTAGEDLLKVGKLNLVDLAGSENIGRSGAENKRAREAGMINQSLLTLGRVINALVDNAQHIPYRESKLTRLLQDSLGGRTKTCIIATISPARSNLEETLSTLDYALRAKSIRNKPELNQRMTRNSLLKEYIAEIERLKADLHAAREKSGIFLSEERWNQLNAEQELRQTELLESKKQVQIIEGQMRAVREEFEQTIGLLMKRDEELKVTKGKLEKTEAALTRMEEELQETKIALNEEVIVRKAYQDTEENLNVVAEGLKGVAAEGVRDVSGLFDKLERKSTILESNRQAVTKYERTISSLTQLIVEKLNGLHGLTSGTTSKLHTIAKEAEAIEQEHLTLQSHHIKEQVEQLREALRSIQGNNEIETSALQTLETTLDTILQTYKEEFATWGTQITSTFSSLCDDIERISQDGMSAVGNALSEVHALLEVVLQQVQQYIMNGLKSLEQSRTIANQTAESEISRLRQQNAILLQMLSNERAQAEKAKEELLSQMSRMLSGFVEGQQSRLQKDIETLQGHNQQVESALENFVQRHDATIDEIVSNGDSMSTQLQQQASAAKRTRDGGLKVLEDSRKSTDQKLYTLRNQYNTAVTSHNTWIHQQTTTYAASTSEVFERHSKAKRARLDTMDTWSKGLQSHYQQMRDGLTSSARSLGAAFTDITVEASALAGQSVERHKDLCDDLYSIRSANQRLAECGARPDVPTGSTPQKKTWDYVDRWHRTSSREILLDPWRRNYNGHSSQNNTDLQENVPPRSVSLEKDEDEDITQRNIFDTRSSTPTSSTMETPHDSLDSDLSAPPSAQSSATKPLRVPRRKTQTQPVAGPHVAPLVDSRRKNAIARPVRRNIVR